MIFRIHPRVSIWYSIWIKNPQYNQIFYQPNQFKSLVLYLLNKQIQFELEYTISLSALSYAMTKLSLDQKVKNLNFNDIWVFLLENTKRLPKVS